MTVIHEMNGTVWVSNEKLGDGVVLALIDYGVHHNTVLMVGFESGAIKFLDSNQVVLTRNDTLGINVKKTEENRRVVATSNISILRLRGRTGSVNDETEGSVSVMFDGENTSTVCSRDELIFI